MQDMTEHPAIRKARTCGMPEPQIIGKCECCGADINPAYAYCQMEDMYFLDELHFAAYAKRHLGLEFIG